MLVCRLKFTSVQLPRSQGAKLFLLPNKPVFGLGWCSQVVLACQVKYVAFAEWTEWIGQCELFYCTADWTVRVTHTVLKWPSKFPHIVCIGVRECSVGIKVAIKTKYHFIQFEYDYASVPLSAPLQLQKTGHFLPKECQKYWKTQIAHYVLWARVMWYGPALKTYFSVY